MSGRPTILNITLSDGRQLTQELGAAPMVIGRDASCDIWADDPSASRRHARFSAAPEGHIVEDLGSKNGILINGVPAVHHLLRDGDVLQLGGMQVVVRLGKPDPDPVTVVVTDRPGRAEQESFSHPGHMRLSQQRLETIYDLSGRLTRLRDWDGLLQEALDVCFEMLQFERGAIAVRKVESRGVDWPVVRHLRGKEGELTISRSALSRALEKGETVIVTENPLNQLDPTISMVQHGIRSAMCVPLLYEDEVLGVIYGDRVSTAAVYSQEDADFLMAIAKLVSIGLKNARLLEEQKQKVKLEKDLELARRIQTGLFPRSLPERPDLFIAASNEPGNRVSGDYYDALELPDGRIWLIIADVTGEGIAAALLMAHLQAAVRVTIMDGDDPGALLTRWNRLIVRNTDTTKFVTILVALLDPKAGALRMSNAGHPHPFLIRIESKEVVELAMETQFPLGIVEDVQYTSRVFNLGKGPALFFAFTDGVSEARTAADELYGTGRLAAVLAGAAGEPPRKVLSLVSRDIVKYRAGAPQTDDITMLALQTGGTHGDSIGTMPGMVSSTKG